MSDLKQAIRKALAGSSSQQPVDTKTLHKHGTKAQIDLALGEMYASREINTAMTLKGGVQSVQCWLTGAAGMAPTAFLYQYPPNSVVRVHARASSDTSFHSKTYQATVKPTASTSPKQHKEQPMNTPTKRTSGNQPSELRNILLDLITRRPGIAQAEIVSHALQVAPGTTQVKASKTLLNLVHSSKKLRTEGKRGSLTYFLNDGSQGPKRPSTWPGPTKKILAGARPSPIKAATPVGASSLANNRIASKLAPTKDSLAKPLPASKHATCAKKQTEPDACVDDAEVFAIVITERYELEIVQGAEHVVLNLDQIKRLHRFIARLYLEGAPA